MTFGKKCSKIEFARFSFHVGLLLHQLFVIQTTHRKQCEFWCCIKQTCQLWRDAIPKLKILGTHNQQTFRHNALINELLLTQFYLFNIRPKLHHHKWQKLCVTRFQTFSTSPADAVLHPTLIRKLCYKLSSIITFTIMQTFDPYFSSLLNGEMLTGSVTCNFQNLLAFRWPVWKRKSW